MLKLKRCFSNGFQFHARHHQFTSLILYSTSPTPNNGSTNPLMLQILINSVGFAEDEAVSIVTNCKVSHRFTSTSKSQLVVDYLKSSGFDDTHIRKLVTVNPTVLRSDVEKTLKPKIRVFQELGFSGSDIGLIISRHPLVLKRSLNGHIVPALELLKSCIGTNEQLLRLLLKTQSQMLLSRTTLKDLPENLLLLQRYGVPREKIEWFVLRGFLVLFRSTRSLEEIMKGVEEKLGIPRTSKMFLYGMLGMSAKMGDRLKPWLEVFRSFGWTETEISQLVGKFPPCLTVAEDAMRVKLKYFMEDLGYGPDYLVAHPAILTYSIEKKIVPRMAVIQAIKEKQLLKRDVCFYTIVSMSEYKFMEKYMLPIRDQLPELYDYYIQTKAGSLIKTLHAPEPVS